ncbi:flagellar filament capping protein FliD [Aminipila sp.]|uniref:flagellar filament capping protein FliD n=1 Tax=Aminipila sp. TaxID=2060095 RepID=UPI0028A11BFA|nr:flagellar filament capping protein FliD [Aminipila sp.]
MTSVNSLSSSTSSTKTSGYTAKGFTGLASGMDTEEVVQAMTSDIQAKIDKVKQEQQKYTWKQEAYRTVISSLTSFQDKFFSYSSPSTNLLNTALYNCSKKVSQGANASKISVTSSSTSNDAAYKITSVKALATKTRGVGNCSIGGNTISSGDISFAPRTTNVVAGKEFNITYDNVKYTLTIPDSGNVSPEYQGLTTSTLLNEALRMVKVEGSSTTSLADKLTFTTSGDKLELKSTYSGDSRSFTITGADSTTLGALGFNEGQSGSASNPIVAVNPINVLQTGPFSVEGKKLTFNLDGLSKTISFTEAESNDIMNAGDDNAKMAMLAQTINNKLKDSFGQVKVNGIDVNKVSATAVGTKLNFVVQDSTSVLKITSPTLDTIGTNSIFGMESGITNRLDNSKTIAQLAQLAPSGITPTTDNTDPNKKLYKITVNGKDFEFKGSDQLSSVLSKINTDADAGVTINYLNTTNKFDITSDEYGKLGKINISDGGSGDLAKTLFGNIADSTLTTDEAKGITGGTDLEMTIRYDGDTVDTPITRNSNTVSLDGIKFNVEGTFESTTEAVSFKTESNTDDTIKVIKQMAEEYNKILDSVNELVTTKSRTNKRNQATYEPLTDAQKAKMTSSEIEKWETKAQKGILFGDSTLSQLASTLRFAFSSMVGDMGFAKDIGITAASSYSGNGKITINETKLKEALTNDPEKVKAMFTASAEEAPNLAQPTLSGGFATRVKTVMETYAKSTGAYKGKLVQLAGLQNNATTNDNYIDRQQKILSNKLENLETLLKKRQDRYQSQFTKLETYISKMNSQSSWLSSSTSS